MLHAKFQVSSHCAFTETRFFQVFLILAYVKHVTPGAGPVLTQGAQFEQTWQRSTR